MILGLFRVGGNHDGTPATSRVSLFFAQFVNSLGSGDAVLFEPSPLFRES